MRHIVSRLGLVILVAGLLLPACQRAVAEEEAERFLDALRTAGYYDLALEYVEQLRTSPVCPTEFKRRLDYEAGMLWLQQAVRSPGLRDESLQKAAECFQRYLKANPKGVDAAKAALQLGNVVAERAKDAKRRAEKEGIDKAEKDRLLKEARDLYQQAQQYFERAEQLAYEAAKRLETEAQQDRSKIPERDEARRQLLAARLAVAGAIYETGKTYPSNAKQFKDLIGKAASRYEQLFEKYQDYEAGLIAGVRQGIALRDLGRTKEAIDLFKRIEALLGGLGGEADVIANMALAERLQTLIEQKDYQTALDAVDKWEEQVEAESQRNEEGLRVHLLAGKAALLAAKQPKVSKRDQNRLLNIARQHLQFVMRFPSSVRSEAQLLLADDLLRTQVAVAEAKTYQEAKDAADLAWATMIVNQGRVQETTDAKEKQELESEIARLRDEAFANYRTALRLAKPETDVEELNLIRLRLAYLHWLKQQYYEAAVIGRFVALRYPQSVSAKPAAEVAVKAFRVLYGQLRQEGKDASFEARQLEDLVDYLVRVWPDEAVTGTGRFMLLDVLVDENRLQEAEQLVVEIPPDSADRVRGELRLGQAYWQAYVREAAKPEDTRLPVDQLEQLRNQAEKWLTTGLKRAGDTGQPADYSIIYSALSLANLLMLSGRTDEAVKWLEHPNYGPAKLTLDNDPVTNYGNFRIEALKTALRAYVGTRQLEKAETVMNRLEKIAGEGAADTAREITRVYIALGQELQTMLKQLEQENKAQEAEQVRAAFKVFLERIRDRQQDGNFASMYWVAETLYNMASSMDPGTGPIPEEAKQYYKSAAQTYLTILKQLQKDPSFGPEGAATAVQTRLAAALRGMGQYKEALQLLLDLLAKQPAQVSVQMEAARTYQEWADRANQPEYFLKAIVGGNPQDGKNLVWGWAGIARRLAPYEQYRAMFHQAWYNAILCKMKLALTRQGSEQREILKKAERDIVTVLRLYPNLGGEEMAARYDSLARKIQRFLGERQPLGLQKYKQETQGSEDRTS